MPEGGQRTPKPTGQRGVEAVVAGVGSRAPQHSWGWGTEEGDAGLAGEVGLPRVRLWGWLRESFGSKSACGTSRDGVAG